MIPYSAALPPREALDWFRAKGLKLGFDYREVWREEHAIAFTVAKILQLDLLADVRAEVDRALADGLTFRDFEKRLTPILQEKGWWGVKEMTDPLTGETQQVQLGSPRRLRTIYDTNLRTARAAGQWERIQRTKEGLPYLLYTVGPSREHRPEHVSWHGTLLPVDHPWFKTHFAPNGWGCKCRIRQVSHWEYERLLKNGIPAPATEATQEIDPKTGLPTGRHTGARVPVSTTAPKTSLVEWTNKRTGEVQRVPKGIDPGWDYNPGEGRQAHLQKVLAQKQEQQPAPKQDYVPQKTAKAVARWIVDADIVDYADFSGIKPDVANAVAQGLFEHIRDFPELRRQQKFTGSSQAQIQRWYDIESERLARGLGVPRDQVARWIKKPKVKGNSYAHSWAQKDVSGIAVNTKWGKDPAAFQSALRNDVLSRWHPQGCDTIKSVIDHEMAHQLDELLDLSNDAAVKALYNELSSADSIGEQVSRYAEKDIAEFIAESWAESRNNPVPRDSARRISEIVWTRYRSRVART